MIPVDPSYRLIASGNVEAVREWTETEQGRRRPDVQASNDQGIPLWQVEGLRSVQGFGASKTGAGPGPGGGVFPAASVAVICSVWPSVCLLRKV